METLPANGDTHSLKVATKQSSVVSVVVEVQQVEVVVVVVVVVVTFTLASIWSLSGNKLDFRGEMARRRERARERV